MSDSTQNNPANAPLPPAPLPPAPLPPAPLPPAPSPNPTIRLSLPESEKPGERIGRYKLLQLIGEGGMGSVWMAEQEEPVRRRVALKVIKLGMDTKQVIGRFEAERQALALMDHPNIAKVLDAGSTENGRPFFAMELVKGIPITKYCDDHKLGTEERLKLFTDVCHAIQHAHQKGIIHRDIKPSNILVTLNDGVPMPKVIDFGIAKATTGQTLTDKTVFTAFEQFIGTPAYMSPEQAEMNSLDIDTRSDIYALGVLLYELLTGKTPFDAKALLAKGLDEIRRIIREEEPPRPSTRLSTLDASEQTILANQRHSEPPKLLGIIRGDLDWIVMKTLEKDRTRRYDTANGLAMDIQRYLHSEPIVARPPSQLYRFKKLIRRNKLAFAAAGAVSVALVAGLVVSILFYRREAEAHERALAAEAKQSGLREEAEKAREEEMAARKREQEKSRQLAETLSQLEQQKLNEVVTKDGPSKALAFLAHALRRNPDNYRAAYRLLSMLSYQDVARLVSQRKFDGQVRATCYGPAGPLILTTSGELNVWLWDYRQEKPLAGPLGHAAPVTTATFTPSARQFLVTLSGGSVEVWNTTNTAQRVCVLKPQSSFPIHAIRAFSHDESKIVTSSQGEARNYRTMILQVWDLHNGQPLTKAIRYEQSGFGGTTINFAGNGSQVTITEYAGGQSTKSTLDLATGSLSTREQVSSMIEPQDRIWVRAITYATAEDGVRMLDSMYGARKLLLPLTSIKEKTQNGEEALLSVSDENISPDGGKLLTVSKDRTVSLWDTGPHSIIPLRIALSEKSSVSRYTSRQTKAELNGDGQWLLAIDDRATARIWDAVTGKFLVSLAEPGTVFYARIGPDGQTAVTVQTNGWMRLWRLADGRPLTAAFRDGPAPRTRKETDRLADLSFSGDGSRLAAAWSSGAAQVWDVVNERLLTEVRAHSGPTVRAVLSRDGKRLATVGEDHTASVWDATTGAALTSPLKHDGLITSCQFSPDGEQLATASKDKTVRLWSSQTGQALLLPLRHEAEVSSVQFAQEGGMLITISEDQTVRFWEVKTGATVKTIKPGGSTIILSQDGRFLVVDTSEGLQVWDVATATPLSQPLFLSMTTTYSYRYQGAHFSLSADGQRLAVNTGSEVLILDLPRISGSVPDWLSRLAETLAGQKITEQGLEERVSPEEFLALRLSLLAGGNDDVYRRWAKWFLADRLSATVSPFSPVSVEQFVKGCIEENSPSTLEQALLLDPGNVKALGDYLSLTAASFVGEEDALLLPNTTLEQRKQWRRGTARRAEALANALLGVVPDSAVAWHVKALALHRLEQYEDALAALVRANPTELGPAYWNTKGLVLEKLSRNDEAYQAFSKAIEVAKSKSPKAIAASEHSHRSRFLSRQNRIAEAAADACVAKGIPLRDPTAKTNLIDLSLTYTAALKTQNLLDAGNDIFEELPAGIHTLGQTEFDIRGIIHGSRSYNNRSGVSSIAVNSRCWALHFLQTAAYAGWGGNEGAHVGKYIVRYADQQTQEIPILFGKHLRDWFYYENGPVEANEAPMVWVGLNDRARRGQSFVRLYTMSWTNPFPDLEIRSIDFEYGVSQVTPILIALTAETNDGITPSQQPSEVSKKDGALSETLATLEQAIERKPDYVAFVRAKVALLERMNRTDEALSTFSKTISLVEAKGASATNVLRSVLFARSALLRRMNRIGEAQADWLRASSVPARDAQTSPKLIDLTPYYNGSLIDGWIPSSRFGTTADRNLDELPRGVQDFAGVRFDVRGLVQLAGNSLNKTLGASFPTEVKSIRVSQQCRRLNFLQGTGWRVADGAAIGRYTIHYAGGQQRDVPIIYGENVRDWWYDPKLSEPTERSVVAWTGMNAAVRAQDMALRLYKSVWDNPAPDSTIESIDFTSENSTSSPFLIAITAE